MKVPPSLDAAALSPGEIHAELETRLPHTWRRMPDFDTGLEDLTAWVWLLQDTCHRDGFAAGFAEAQPIIDAARRYRQAETDGTPRMWRGKELQDLANVLDEALGALDDSAEKEGG
jgi:hypothetical protein